MALINRGHVGAKWRPVGTSGRLWIGEFGDSARLSIQPTRDLKASLKETHGNPRKALLDDSVEECERVAAILEPILLHAVKWIESQRGAK
mgnify:CR=1 FL=1